MVIHPWNQHEWSVWRQEGSVISEALNANCNQKMH